MNTNKWIEENRLAFSSNSGDIIRVKDLEELLKTHVIVPKEVTQSMIGAAFKKYEAHMTPTCSMADEIESIYKAMIEASNE